MIAADSSAWRRILGPRAPAWVPEVLAALVRDLDGVVGIVVHGSSGRGDFVVTSLEGRPLVLSDVEFVVVAESERRARATSLQLAGRMSELAEGVPSDQVFFSVDYSVVGPWRLAHLPPWFITFEKKSGSVVLGDDRILDVVPALSADDLDLRESNETIVWRLLNLAVHFPIGILDGRTLREDAARVWAYFSCRNVLDLTTWLCPHLGIMEVGFRARATALMRHPEWSGVEAVLGGEFGGQLRRALLVRADPANQASDPRDYATTVLLLRAAFQAITNPDPRVKRVLRAVPDQPFLGIRSPRRMATVLRGWRPTTWMSRPWDMLRFGHRLVRLHGGAVDGSYDGERWTTELEDAIRGTDGFVAAEVLLRRWHTVQRWWGDRYE